MNECYGVLHVSGLSHAQRHKRRYAAVLTIEDPGVRHQHKLRFHRKPSPDHLVLAFEDVDDEDSGLRTATAQQVEDGLAFLRAHANVDTLTHCFHGVGRSAAFVLAALAERLCDADAALRSLRDLQPLATPNLVVLRHADSQLGLGLRDAVMSEESRCANLKRRRDARAVFCSSNRHLYQSL